MEEKFSCYVFLRTTEVIEVTQEITNTGIIPLEALRAHLSKRPHILVENPVLDLHPLERSPFCPLRHSAHLQRIEVGKSNFPAN